MEGLGCCARDMDVEDAIELGRRSIYHATFRDAVSGGTVSGVPATHAVSARVWFSKIPPACVAAHVTRPLISCAVASALLGICVGMRQAFRRESPASFRIPFGMCCWNSLRSRCNSSSTKMFRAFCITSPKTYLSVQ